MTTVTILQVAQAAGVSKTTASDILRRAGRSYNATTVENVQQTAARLGYRANAAARLLRQGKTDLIGIAVGVRQRPHLNRLVAAAHDECLKRGYQPALFEPLHLMPQQHFSPFPSPEMLAGLLSVDLSLECAQPEFYLSLREKMPVVALYSIGVPLVDEVTTDWQAATDLAVQHLTELGHRRIAFACDPKSKYPSDREKHAAWKKTVKLYAPRIEPRDITFSFPREVLQRGGAVVDATHINAIAGQIARALQSFAAPPTALLCQSDEVALCLQSLLQKDGWTLPRQLSIIGFDGIDFCEYSQPALTTVTQDVGAIAAAAFDRLLHNLQNFDDQLLRESISRRIAPQLTVRASTALLCEKTPQRKNIEIFCRNDV